ncbi:hypothetical protein [Nostoc sp.]
MNPFSSTAIYRLSYHNFIQYSFIWIGSSVIAACTNSNQPSNRSFRLDNVTFGTSWIAQTEQDGFYQAMSTIVSELAEVRAAATPRVSTKTFRCHSQNGCPPGSQW